MKPKMGGTSLILAIGLLSFFAVCFTKESDNFFHHREDDEDGFFTPEISYNNLLGIFNKSQPVIFVNNPDLLKEHQSQSFVPPIPTSPSSSDTTTSYSGGLQFYTLSHFMNFMYYFRYISFARVLCNSRIIPQRSLQQRTCNTCPAVCSGSTAIFYFYSE